LLRRPAEEREALAATPQSSPKQVYQLDQDLKHICKSLLILCRQRPEETVILFELVQVLGIPMTVDFTFLTDFLRYDLPTIYKATHKRCILHETIKLMQTQNTDLKVKVLKEIVTPMLIHTFRDPNTSNADVIDEELARLLMGSTLGSPSNLSMGSTESAPSLDALRVELLKLTTLLIQFMGPTFVEHRKELIKFAWSHLKAEDSACRHWAYVKLCRFIAVYDTPSKLILQVYVALLRAFQPEYKELVKMALDALIPALTIQLSYSEFVKAMKWTRKVMFEENHAMLQLVHMFHLIIRHAPLFYPYRSHFVPPMIQHLTKLGLPPQCPTQHRQLAVAIADTVIAWEWYRQERNKLQDSETEEISAARNIPSDQARIPEPVDAREAQGEETDGLSRAKRVKDGVGDARPQSAVQMKAPARPADRIRAMSMSNANLVDDFTLHPSTVETISNFLVRLVLFAADNKMPTMGSLSVRCTQLFRKLVKLVPMAEVKLAYLDKLVQSALENYAQYLKQQSVQPQQAAVPPPQASGPQMKSQAQLQSSTQPPLAPITTQATAMPSNVAPASAGTIPQAAAPPLSKPAGAPNVARSAAPNPGKQNVKAIAGLTNKVLIAFLDLFSAALGCRDGPSPFISRNLAKIREMMVPFFASDDVTVQRKLRGFLTEYTRLFPPIFGTSKESEAGLYQKLKELVDRRLRLAAAGVLDMKPEAREAPHVQTPMAPKETQNVSGVGAPTKCNAGQSALWLLDELCICVPSYVDNHGAALVRLAQKLAKDNMNLAAQTSKTGSLGIVSTLQELGQEVDVNKTCATSHMALLNEACTGAL
jgi:hypothetical protein